jgi:hypothetical protein
LDPSTTLATILALVKEIQAEQDSDVRSWTPFIWEAKASHLAEHAAALDDWIQNGGFLPQPWQETGTVAVPIETARWAAEALVTDAIDVTHDSAPHALVMMGVLKANGIGNAAELCRDQVQGIADDLAAKGA